MMKIYYMIPFMLMKNMKFYKMISPFLIILTFIIMSSTNLSTIWNQFQFTDMLSYSMMLLTLMTVNLIIMSSELYYFNQSKYMIFIIMILLMMTFSMSNMFYFYILFEIILIPTMILITKSGKQPERLQAGIYLIMYTITASLPLLISIISMKNMSFMIMFIMMYKYKINIILMLAFLVKMPMFFTHLWLPKAHVEAPLEGSMILAAILLKLGGYGLIRILPICLIKISMISSWIMSISMMGAISTSFNCIRQKDMKALIAYSSVAHMALTLCSIFSMNKIGLLGAFMMMIAHGLSSSALFLLVNDLYLKIHSRNIMMLKGLMILNPNITFWWFIFMAINISAPPSINTMSEMYIMSSLMMWNLILLMPMILASILVASFSLMIFINISHNKNIMNPFMQTSQKIFMVLFLHAFPLILFLMKMEMMYL